MILLNFYSDTITLLVFHFSLIINCSPKSIIGIDVEYRYSQIVVVPFPVVVLVPFPLLFDCSDIVDLVSIRGSIDYSGFVRYCISS